ncbi:MAG: diacylglycerol kinase family lipid kinase [Chloroflexi bacterium]|nr:diacylglycerol kinase family lipid kinase [Chloroflexota bacterium]
MKAMLIFNPAAGAREVQRELEQVVAYWERRGWEVSFRQTWGAGDATTFAREAVATGCQAVFVAGGDGVVGEAADGLAGSDVALGVLPAGVGNVWALEMGIPTPSPLRRHPLLDAAEVLAQGEIRRIDLGRAGQRHFILWAGIGLDAKVAERMEPRDRPTKRLGTLAYAVAAVLVAKDFRGTRTRVVIDGQNINTRSILIIVSNAQLYARLVRVAAEAYLDDGLLDVCIFKGVNLASTVHHAIRVFAHSHLRDPQVEYYRCRKVSISTATPLPVQVDGDPIGTTPMEFEIVPQALNIIVPQNSSPRLFLNARSGLTLPST